MKIPSCECINKSIGAEHKLLYIQPCMVVVRTIRVHAYSNQAVEYDAYLERNFCPQCGEPYKESEERYDQR